MKQPGTFTKIAFGLSAILLSLSIFIFSLKYNTVIAGNAGHSNSPLQNSYAPVGTILKDKTVYLIGYDRNQSYGDRLRTLASFTFSK